MAVNQDSKDTTLNEMSQQQMNPQQVGYPSYGSQQPQVVVTNAPPDYNHIAANVQYGNPADQQSCCLPQSHQTAIEMDQEGEVEDFLEVKPHLRLDFNGVFQEPKLVGAASFVTTYNSNIYYWTKRCLYIFLSCIIGPIMAFTFGLVFALMDILVIWCMNPSVRLMHVFIRFINNVYRPLSRVMLDPVFESVGQMYRFRNAGEFTERKYKLDVSGINLGGNNSEPTHQHTA